MKTSCILKTSNSLLSNKLHLIPIKNISELLQDVYCLQCYYQLNFVKNVFKTFSSPLDSIINKNR